MTEKPLRDPDLAALAKVIDLRQAATPEDWQRQALARLGPERFEQLQARRSNLAKNPASEAEFYQYVTADVDVMLAMLEGRIGYYDAVLPRVLELLQDRPPARILDLGSYVGLVSLYLSRRFPDATVVGIERCEGAVQRARAFLQKNPRPNVEFVHGDYLAWTPPDSFDLVLSLQTTPTYLLPQVPSQSPESYLRGRNLEAAASESSARPVAQALASMRRLAGQDGWVLLQERFPDIARASRFLYLLGDSALAVERLELLAWQAANERAGVQQAPLIVATPHAVPAPVDESRLIGLYYPQPETADVSRLGFDQPTTLTGVKAHWSFAALAGLRQEVCVQGRGQDGHRFHIHVGLLAGTRAYVYTCTTADYRELKICDARYARMLFTPVAEQLLLKQMAGEILDAEPEPRALAGIFRAKFGW